MTLTEFLDLHYPVTPSDKGVNLYERAAAHLGWTQASLCFEHEINASRQRERRLTDALEKIASGFQDYSDESDAPEGCEIARDALLKLKDSHDL